MSGNILKYKGYLTRVEFSAEDRILYGKIEGISDLVTFESASSAEIEKEFHDSVDDYLAFCESEGKAPQKAYSGNFNVRIPPELHRKLDLKASEHKITLNAAVSEAISLWTASNLETEGYNPVVLATINEKTQNIWDKLQIDPAKPIPDQIWLSARG